MTKQPVPASIINAPTLLPWLSPIWKAFYELCTERRDGGSIPWGSIHHYAVACGYGDDFDRFHQLIRGMDEAYLEYHKDKAEKKRMGGDKKNKRIATKRR